MPARGRDSHDRLSLDCTLSEQNAQRLYYSLGEAARADGLEILIARGRNWGASVERLAGTEI